MNKLLFTTACHQLKTIIRVKYAIKNNSLCMRPNFIYHWVVLKIMIIFKCNCNILLLNFSTINIL